AEVTERLLARCAAIRPGGEVVTREEATGMAGVDLAELDAAGTRDAELVRRCRLGLPTDGGVAEPDGITVAVPARRAVVSGLQSALRRQVGATTGRELSAAGARELLASPGLVLRIEGAGDAVG